MTEVTSNIEHQGVEAYKSKTKTFFDGLRRFFKKYFCEGQKLNETHVLAIKSLDSDTPWHQRVLVTHRRLIGILIPFTFFQLIWWSLSIKHNFFAFFPDRYLLSVTMVFGAVIAGATSEGGGAVAFPVMTLALGIKPTIARDFSLMIQSCGMSCAAFTILFMRIKLEWHSILFCNLGALFGLIVGFEVIDDLLSPPIKKLGFVSIWFSFAFALFLLNRQYKRKTFDSIPDFRMWKGFVLVLTGFVGGIFSAIAGSGVDICSFSVLSLLFRVNEKVSTPTSVILMAFTSCCGFYWRQFMTDTGAEIESWQFLAVCVPIVVFFAPFGSFISSHFHRQVLAFLIYILDTIALVTALAVIPMSLELWLICGGLILGGFAFFFILSKLGEKIIVQNKVAPIDDPKQEENLNL